MYRAMPSRLSQVSSTGAVTVVATIEVVPVRATILVIRSSAAAVPSITSWPTSAVNMDVNEAWNDRHLASGILNRAGGQLHLVAMADGRDAAALDENHAVVDLFFRREDAAGVNCSGRHTR